MQPISNDSKSSGVNTLREELRIARPPRVETFQCFDRSGFIEIVLRGLHRQIKHVVHGRLHTLLFPPLDTELPEEILPKCLHADIIM